MWKKIIAVLVTLGVGALMVKTWLDWKWNMSHPIMKNIGRIKLWDPIYKKDYNLNRKMHFSTVVDVGTDVVDVAIFGCGIAGYAPYYTVFMEMAYARKSGNLNVVIWEKGDNPLEISVDGKLIGTTDHIQQSEVYMSDVPALVRKKWVSFNFKNVERGAITLSATPKVLQYGEHVTLQATLTKQGSPVAGKQINIFYKNTNDVNFAGLVSIEPTDNNGAVFYEQPVDASWFREDSCQLKAIYQTAESNIVTLTLEGAPPPKRK